MSLQNLFYKVNEIFRNISNEPKILPHFIEEKKYIWFKHPLLQANKTSEIYIYYNPQKNDTIQPFNDNSCILFYTFDDENANDKSGNGYNGVVFGPGASFTDGINNSLAIDFGRYQHSSNYVRTDDIPLFTSMTFSFWVYKYDDNGSLNAFFSLADSGVVDRIIFAERPSSNNYLVTINGTEYTTNVQYDHDLEEWNHLVLVLDGDVAKIYRNGKYLETISISALDTTYSNDNVLILALEQDSLGGGFSNQQSLLGKLDNFRIFNKALTDNEISKLYQIESLRFEKPDQVFEFFDDFENLDNWEYVKADDSYVEHVSNHVKITGGYGGKTTSIRTNFEMNLPNKCLVRARIIIDHKQDFGGILIAPDNELDLSNYYGYKNGYQVDYWASNTSKHCIRIFNNGNETLDCGVFSGYFNPEEGVYYYIGMKYDGSVIHHLKPTLDASIEVDRTKNDTLYSGNTWKRIFLADWYLTVWRFDYIYVSKIFDTDPTITYLDEERGCWEIDGIHYSRRKKILITNNMSVDLDNIQINLDFTKINDQSVKVVLS